jgi:potassium efflux system protein
LYTLDSKPVTKCRSSRVAGITVVLVLALSAVAAHAQTVIPSAQGGEDVSIEQIDAAIAAVEAQEGLDDTARSRVTNQLRDARAQIQNRRAAEDAAREFEAALQTAPAQTEALLQELAQEPPPRATAERLGITDSMSLAELEQGLASELATLTTAEAELAELESRIQGEESRPEEIRRRISELRQADSDLQERVNAAPPANEPQLLTDARRLAARLRLEASSAEVTRLEQELLSRTARLGLLDARRDLAVRNVVAKRGRVSAWQTAVNERRQSSALLAQQEAVAAGLAAADAHPVVRAIATDNVELTRELPAIAEQIERATQASEQIEGQARQIEEDLARSRQRFEIGGVSQVVGRLFAEERRNLPQVSQFRSEVRERRRALASIGLAQVRIDEMRRNLTPLSARLESEMQVVATDVSSAAELASIEKQIRGLLQSRRELLSQAAATYTSYLRALGDLDVAQRRLLDAADEYKSFLDSNLLWIPNTSVINLQSLQNVTAAARWALSPASWWSVWKTLLSSVRDNALLASAALLLIGLSFAITRRLKSQFRALNSKVGRLSVDHIGLTLGAIAISALRALPLPLTLGVAGFALRQNAESAGFAAAVANSLLTIAPFLYNVFFYRVLCASEGVVQVHFGWSRATVEVARRQLDRIAAVGTPLIFVSALVYASPVAAYRDSLGRLTFVALLIVLSGAIGPLFRAARASDDDEKARRAGWLRDVGHILFVGLPLVLAALALIGYMYTAVVLTGHLVRTFWLVLALVITNLVVLRWLSLARRKIAWRMALEKRAERLAEGGEQETQEADHPAVQQKPIDLDAVDKQTRRLLRAALIAIGIVVAWAIWSEVLPALGVLERVALWSQTGLIDGREAIVPVTLADLLLAVVIVGVTMIASKNLPGLMEIAVLQRLTLEPGSRYAINTLLRYVVVTVGAISVLNIIGWDWSQIQWLVAALSVGLGFGLQEIVANFVSGLIILFERPVRVGDTVTVGEVTGTVSQLRIRATTITDWDRKEIVVPNKSFITEQVVNWTLSDPITRIVVPVGIAYESDIKLAHQVMEETLRAMPLVLDEPPPRVFFTGFGDSSLNFKLYVYSRQLSDRLPLTHAVHEEILTALRAHGITIPFPQRDLHLYPTEGAGRSSDTKTSGKPD